MRRRFLGAGVFAMLACVAVGAQESRSALDAPTTLRLPNTLPSCGIITALTKLARTSRVPIGFEEGPDCRGKWPRVSITYDDRGFDNITVRDILDHLVALSPDYRWSEMNGVAVVRPVASWNDPTDALNLRIEPFHIDNATVKEILAVILKLPAHDSILTWVDNRAFSIAFNGGTMVDALNALVQARGGAGWNAGLFMHPRPSGEDPSPSLMMSIRTFSMGDRVEGEGAIGMGTPLPRLLATR